MPIYEYKCANGHVFEAIQSMSDDPLSRCEQCGAPVQRVFHPIAVHFKGSGFYSTDYGSKNKQGADGKESEPKKDSSDTKKDKAADKASAKSDSGSSSSSGSGSGD